MNSNVPEGGSTYEIRVRGTLPPNMVARLGSMNVSPGGNEAGVTTLIGPVGDQSELVGILNTLHELRTSLLSVRQIEEARE